jgi:hypothetical protein
MLKASMIAATLALGTAAMTVPAAAQTTEQAGLVNVTIGDVTVLEDFLNETQIAALNNLNVPVAVQVPIGVAANVCNVSAAVLARGAPAGGSCEAESGSQALAQAVNRQLLDQRRQ